MREIELLEEEEHIGIFVARRSGLPITKDGPQPPVFLMISGLPDSADTWNSFATHFHSNYHVVTMAYPFMDKESLPTNQKWGYSAQQVTTSLAAVIQRYRSLGCSEVYLIGHDWGSMAVLKYTQDYPDTITKVVFEDVGLFDPAKNSRWEIFVIMCYQLFLVSLFVLTRIVGGTWWYKILFHCYPWKSLGPLTIDMMPFDKLDTYPHKLYPCYQSMKLAITNPEEVAADKFANVPQLFLYGCQKRAMFHSQIYLDKLKRTDGCDYKEYTDAGHWIHVSHADEMAADVVDFFKS